MHGWRYWVVSGLMIDDNDTSCKTMTPAPSTPRRQTIHHMLLHCPFNKEVWFKLLRRTGQTPSRSERRRRCQLGVCGLVDTHKETTDKTRKKRFRHPSSSSWSHGNYGKKGTVVFFRVNLCNRMRLPSKSRRRPGLDACWI